MIIFRITIGRSWIQSPLSDPSAEAVSTGIKFENEVGSSNGESIVMDEAGVKLGTESMKDTAAVHAPQS